MKIRTFVHLGWSNGLLHHIWFDGKRSELIAIRQRAIDYVVNLGHVCECTDPRHTVKGTWKKGVRLANDECRMILFTNSPNPGMMIKLAGRVPD